MASRNNDDDCDNNDYDNDEYDESRLINNININDNKYFNCYKFKM